MKKRSYKSVGRNAQAAQTKERILISAKNLFESEGFEYVTIEKIAQVASVSIPTIYSLFQSKRGILRALMDEVFPKDQFDILVEKSNKASSPKERLLYSAKIARQIYDAEKAQMDVFRGAAFLAPEFKKLEKEREMRRYTRQEVTITAMAKEKSLSKNFSINKARDVLWAFTGRDIYRMLVVEQGWTAEEYEQWLAQLLAKTLIDHTIE
ncbi:MAG: TetR/AcrR family transcriptional regulator [Simkaniaceae bacterium]|nr:MAG: TetR/AcrR family transcriptional regulator [Simkaniaceae bacterium]